MDLQNLGRGLTNGLERIGRRFGDAMYAPLSAAGMEDAHNVYYHALKGEHFTPTVGVQGHFDPLSEDGQEIIEEARQKFRDAKATYLWLHRHSPEMSHPDDVLTLTGERGEQLPAAEQDGQDYVM